MTLHPVSTNFICDRATRELGESHPALSMVDACYRLLLVELAKSRAQVTGRAAAVLAEFEDMLKDSDHDSSFLTTCALAKDAYEEAKVVSIRRSPRLEFVTCARKTKLWTPVSTQETQPTKPCAF